MTLRLEDLDVPWFLSSLNNDELRLLHKLFKAEFKRRFRPSPLEVANGVIPKNHTALIPIVGKKLKPLPKPRKPWNQEENINYFHCLMSQDWSFLFDSPDFDDSPNYYVYAHVCPTGMPCKPSQIGPLKFTGPPFYIGKGKGERAYDFSRNQGHGQLLKSLLSKGYEAAKIVNIVCSELTERKALEIEAKLIYFFGTKYEITRKNGILCNLDLEKRPMFRVVNSPIKTTIIRRSYGQVNKYESL